jgi:hypothetical protein
MKTLPEGEGALVIRTDFTNQQAWDDVGALIRSWVPEGLLTDVRVVDDPGYQGITTEQLLALVPDNGETEPRLTRSAQRVVISCLSKTNVSASAVACSVREQLGDNELCGVATVGPVRSAPCAGHRAERALSLGLFAELADEIRDGVRHQGRRQSGVRLSRRERAPSSRAGHLATLGRPQTPPRPFGRQPFEIGCLYGSHRPLRLFPGACKFASTD